MSDSPSDQLIKIGQITAAHGVKGEVRVFPLTTFPERFATLRKALVGPDARPVTVRFIGTVKQMIILQIEGVTDRTEAEKLRLQYIQVPKAEIHPLPEGHHYVFDLLGLDVVDPDGRLLGKLVAVEESSPAHDIYVIETTDGSRHLVPAVKQFIQQIDVKAGRIVLLPIPGLLGDA